MKAIQITFILISYGNALGIKYANYNELCLNVELKKNENISVFCRIIFGLFWTNDYKNMRNPHDYAHLNPPLSFLSFDILLVLLVYLFQFVLLKLFSDHLDLF